MRYFMEKWNDEVIFNLNYYKSLIDEETKEIELEEFTRDIGSGNPIRLMVVNENK